MISAITPRRVAMRCGLRMIASAIMSAASSGEMTVGISSYSLVGAIIGVRISGMLMIVKCTFSSWNSDAAQRANDSSAALEAT